MGSRIKVVMAFLGFCAQGSIAWTTLSIELTSGKDLVRKSTFLYASTNDAVPATARSSRRYFLQQSALSVPAMTTLATSGAVVTHPSDSKASPALSPSIKLPPIGLGAWAWGDSYFWGYDSKNDEELRKVFDYAVSESKTKTTLFDTAEIYGLFGRSETLLGRFCENLPPGHKVQIATKFAAIPTRTKPDAVVTACQASMKRLGNRPIDLYQIHFPNAWSNEAYWDGLARAYEQGLVKAVGVSNYGAEATRACHAALSKRGIPLTSNQIQMSLLYRHPLENGLLETCRELGVQVLSYSPLALGALTGKYSKESQPTGPRKSKFVDLMEDPNYTNLLRVMDQISDSHAGARKSQVAINWARAKGTIPIPGARTIGQVQQNYGALDWKLSKQEEVLLDEASAKVMSFVQPEASPFPRKDINTGMVMFDS